VAPHGGAMARSSIRLWALENRIQPLRPLGEDGQMAAVVLGAADRPGRRVAQHGQHDQSRAPTCLWRPRGAAAQGIGRSRGGLSTKVHLVVDALGLPLAFEITEGQRHDSKPAKELVLTAGSSCLLADKAYDSEELRHALAARGCSVVTSLISIETPRTSISLPLLWAASSSSARRESTSSNAADSVADPRAET
jgi:transposase